MSSKLLAVLPLLPALGHRELLTVKATVEHLLGQQAQPSALYDALLTVVGIKMPFVRFMSSKAYRSWPENERLFLSFINDTWRVPNKVTETALMVYLLGLLADDLKNRKVPVSVSALAVNLGSVAQVFENNFPGYRSNGTAHLVLKSMVRR